jgi:hypothetical protein
MNNEHKLETISDIIKVVNPENLENFLKDFRGFLTMRMSVDTIAQIFGEGTEVQTSGAMHWIDDGKNDAKITIEVVNKNHG